MDDFRELEVRTIADMEAVARWRSAVAPPSGWVVESPDESESAEDFTGKVGLHGRPLDEEEKAKLHEIGRRLDLRLFGLRGRTGVATLEWLVSAGGTVLARRTGSIAAAVGASLSTAQQRAVWAIDGELADRMAELWGKGLWETAVRLWNGTRA